MGRAAMNKNIQELTQMLINRAQQQAEQILADARHEAQRITADAEQKSKAECEAIRVDYQRQAAEYERREQIRLKMDQRRMLLSAKQQLIDQTVQQVYERLVGQTAEQWVELLGMVLARNPQDKGAQKPQIIVPAGLLAAVQAAVGTQYPVSVGQMQHGFIISYEQFDLNYEVDRLFSYQKEGFERQAAQYLFGDDADE